uniref:LRRNT domain-containing protein n=1 Tax=Ciona savignyi TaxID=51511 RepID=H2ZNX2_CIOSA
AAFLLLLTLHRAHGCPSDCACSGTTVNCTGRGLTSIPSGIPPSTIVLLLNRNQISSISTTLLDHLDSLKTLDLSDNALTSLEEAQFAFQNDAVLEDIRLDYNQITTVSSSLLNGLTALKNMELSNSLISSLPSNFFAGSPSLEVVSLTNNAFSGFENSVSANKLQQLILDGNKLTDYSFMDTSRSAPLQWDVARNPWNCDCSLLKTYTTLRQNPSFTLKCGNSDAEHCFVCSTPANLNGQSIFSVYTELETCPTVCDCAGTTVNCSSRGLTDIPNGIPKTTVTLLLQHNQLSHLRYPTYFNYLTLPKLEVLDLSFNQIRALRNRQFSKLQALKDLRLHNNRITQIMQNISSPNLHSIDLSNNLIHSINPRTFENCSALVEVNISGNNLEYLPPITQPQNSTAVVNWYVDDNPWVCDCQMLNTYQHLINNTTLNVACDSVDIDPYKPCIRAGAEEHTAFGTKPKPQKLSKTCFYQTSCPSSCQCIEGQVDCSNQQLSNILWNFSTNASEIYLNNNSFVVPLLFVSLRKLVRLHLHGNSLSVFTEGTFPSSNKVGVLSISGNFLRFLENDTFSGLSWLRCLNLSHNRIMHIDSDALTTLPNLVTLDLSGNRLTSLGAASVSSTSLKSLILSNNFLVKIAMTW